MYTKFIEIQFDKQGRILGAAVRTYVLERSHVFQVSDPERNYHSFYMLCAAPPEVTSIILDFSIYLFFIFTMYLRVSINVSRMQRNLN